MKKLFLLLCLAGLTAAAFVFLRHQQIDLVTLRGHVDALNIWRASNAAFVVAGFFAVYVLVAALSLPVATWMTLAGGALFGFWQGLLIVSFASTLGATLAFLAARDRMRDRLGHRARPRLAGLATDGPIGLCALRLIPVMPIFAVTLLRRLTPIRTPTFYLVRRMAMLAGTVRLVVRGTKQDGRNMAEEQT